MILLFFFALVLMVSLLPWGRWLALFLGLYLFISIGLMVSLNWGMQQEDYNRGPFDGFAMGIVLVSILVPLLTLLARAIVRKIKGRWNA